MHERRLADYEGQVAQLQETIKGLEEEVVVLRRRLQDAPKRVRILEDRFQHRPAHLQRQAVGQFFAADLAEEHGRREVRQVLERQQLQCGGPARRQQVEWEHVSGDEEVHVH